MPKFDLSTPKGVAKMIKSAGLQKLKWYCQICEKQCRDENGFKCHCSSENHLRKMQFFTENSKKMQYQYSKEFESSFLQVLSSLHGEKPIQANIVYQEFISNKQHTHMNSTAWTTLSGFCKYLGRLGKCKITEDLNGRLMIQFIRRDPEAAARKALDEKRFKDEISEEQRMLRKVQEEIQKAKEMGIDLLKQPEGDDLDRSKLEQNPIQLSVQHIEDKPKNNVKTPSIFNQASESESESESENESENENEHKNNELKQQNSSPSKYTSTSNRFTSSSSNDKYSHRHSSSRHHYSNTRSTSNHHHSRNSNNHHNHNHNHSHSKNTRSRSRSRSYSPSSSSRHQSRYSHHSHSHSH